MHYRCPAATPAATDDKLMLGALLAIKTHRVERLRRQMAKLSREQAQLMSEMQTCRSRQADVTAQLAGKLNWSGTLTSDALLVEQQTMKQLFAQRQDLVHQHQSLLESRQRLQGQQDQLRKDLHTTVKKKEKLRSLLSDE